MSSRSRRPQRLLRAAVIVVMAAVSLPGWLASPARAQTASSPSGSTGTGPASPDPGLGPDLPSVAVTPTETKQSDPNRGQWFVFALASGQTGTTQAKILNPAPVPQTVQLSAHDLTFSPDGTPQISAAKAQSDVGAWATFGVPATDGAATVTVPARGQALVPVTVKVPDNAEPGDHAGVVMASSGPEAGPNNFTLVKRVAVRLYVTVPGVATRAFEVASIHASPDSVLFPRSELVRVRLHNTGRVRLHPKVTVGGVRAGGSDTIIAQTYEDYEARVPVSWAGGPVNEKVVVTTDAGLTRVVGHSQFIVPWALIGLALLAGFALFGLWLLLRRRQRKLAGLRADIRRLELLVTEGVRKQVPVTPPGTRADDDASHDMTTSSAEIRSLETAIKRARRTDHTETIPELALALHEAGGDALDALLEGLEVVSDHPRHWELIAAARTYSDDRLTASNRLRHLDEDDAEALLAPRPARRRVGQPI